MSINKCLIKPEDLEFLNEFMMSESYDCGLSNLQIYYNCSNTEQWWCLKDKNGEIIGIHITNILPVGIGYTFCVMVKPEFRSKKLSHLFTEQRKGSVKMYNASLHSLKHYPKLIQCVLGKMLDYYGVISRNDAQAYAVAYQLPDVQVVKITEDTVMQIYAYDEAIINFDRKKFLRQWYCSSDAYAILAAKNGRCVGFGALIDFKTRCAICPLYADDDKIASAIFAEIVKYVGDKTVYVAAQSHQWATLHFCNSMKLNLFTSEVRQCDVVALDYAKTINIKKVYVSSDFWPV